MANPYYDRLNQYVPGELADGQAVEADFGAVQTGFERVAKDMQERVTKATLINGNKLDGDINLTPGDVGAMRSLNGQKPDANGDLVGLTSPRADGGGRNEVAVAIGGTGRWRGQVAVFHGQADHRAEALEVGIHAGVPAALAERPAVVESQVRIGC